jgi:hypothetical protein
MMMLVLPVSSRQHSAAEIAFHLGRIVIRCPSRATGMPTGRPPTNPLVLRLLATCRAQGLIQKIARGLSGTVPENSTRRDSRGEAESAHHPMRCLRSSTCLQRL